MLASPIETCKPHGVNPDAYLTDLLTKLVNNWPTSRLTELTSWAWTHRGWASPPNQAVEPLRWWAQRTALPGGGVMSPDYPTSQRPGLSQPSG